MHIWNVDEGSMRDKSSMNCCPAGSKLWRFIVIEIVSLLISMGIVLVIGVGAASISGHLYNINHAIPDPVSRGEDLGGGLVMVLSAIGSLLISLPIVVLIHFYAFKKYFTRSERGE